MNHKHDEIPYWLTLIDCKSSFKAGIYEFILQKCSKENVLSVVFLFGLPHSGWNAVLLLTNNPQPIISRDYRGERVDWAGGIYIIMYTL